MSSQASPRTTVVKAFLFTDLVGSTDMKRRLGDAAYADAIARHDELFHRCLTEYAASQEKDIGDGFLAAFDVPSDAVRCALAFQHGIAELDTPEPLKVRVGVNMGEIVRISDGEAKVGEDKLVGLAVDTAARVMGLAQGGQILITRGAFDSARQQLSSAPDGSPLQWLAHGAYLFQGLDDPLEVFEVGIEGLSPLGPPPDSEKAKRAITPGEEDTLGWRPAAGLTIPRRENWTLQEQMGEGGYGEVWLAEHSKTKEKRVFKFCFDPERVRGLRREVVLFRLLRETLGDRDDIVRILEWQFDKPPYFLESEYTAAGDLVQWSEGKGGIGTIPLETRLELVAQTAVALGAAHSVGVLHKDVKPANILITEIADRGEPRASLTDFGIGLITNREALEAKGITAAGLTQTLMAGSSSSQSGTRLYMAPEVIEGKTATTLSDVYALGVLLYQMVVGDFSRSLASGWERDISHELLREDIRACVEGLPERRLQSAGELADRIRSLDERRARGEAERKARAEAEAAREAIELTRRRRRQFAVASVAGSLLTIVVSIVAVQQSRLRTRAVDAQARAQAAQIQAEDAQREEARAREEADRARQEADRARQEAEQGQYVAGIQLATARLEQGEEAFAKVALLKVPEAHRHWEWGHLVHRAWGAMRRESGSETPVIPDDRLGGPASRIWDGAFPRRILTISTQTSAMDSAYFNADGSLIATSTGTGFRGRITIWNSMTGARLWAARGPIGPRGGRFSHDGKWLGVHYSTQGPDIWNSESRRLHWNPSRSVQPVNQIWFTPDDSMFVTSSSDQTVRFYNVQSGEEQLVLDGFSGPAIPDIVFAADGKSALTTWHGQSLRRWDLAREMLVALLGGKSGGGEAEVIQGPPAAGFFTTRISPDLTRAASYHPDGKLMVWDVSSRRKLFTVDVRKENPPLAVSFSRDSSCLVTVRDENTIEIRDATGGKLLTSIEEVRPSVYAPQMSPDGTRLLVAQTDGTAAMIAPSFEIEDNEGELTGHADWVVQASFNSDGSRVVTASHDFTAKVWDARTSQELLTLRGHTGYLMGAYFTPDEKLIVTGSWDNTVRVWDAGTGEQLHVFSGGLPSQQFAGGARQGETVASLARSNLSRMISPDGKRVVTPAPGGAARVRDLDTGETIFTLNHDRAIYIVFYRFSPDGRYIITVPFADTTAWIWDAATGREVHRIKASFGQLWHYNVSLDGGKIVTGGNAYAGEVWDLQSGSLIRQLTRHDGTWMSAQFDRAGQRVVSASEDNTSKIWDVETGKELAVLSGHVLGLTYAEFSPDGERVLTVSHDRTAKVWDLRGNELTTLHVEGRLLYAAWSPDGSQIVATSDANKAYLFTAVPWMSFSGVGDPEEVETRLRLAWKATPEYQRILELADQPIAQAASSFIEALPALELEITGGGRMAADLLRTFHRAQIDLCAAALTFEGQAAAFQGGALNNIAWRAFELGITSPASSIVAIAAFRASVPEGRLLDLAAAQDTWMILDTVAANLFESGFEEEGRALQARAVAADALLPAAQNADGVRRLVERGGSVPADPPPSILFKRSGATDAHPFPANATQQQRAEIGSAVDRDAREYLDDVAPMIDLEQLEARLRRELPAPPSSSTPIREIISALLERLDDLYGTLQVADD